MKSRHNSACNSKGCPPIMAEVGVARRLSSSGFVGAV